MYTQQGESTSMLPTQVARITLTRMQPTSSTNLLSISVELTRIRSTSSHTETHCPNERAVLLLLSLAAATIACP